MQWLAHGQGPNTANSKVVGCSAFDTLIHLMVLETFINIYCVIVVYHLINSQYLKYTHLSKGLCKLPTYSFTTSLQNYLCKPIRSSCDNQDHWAFTPTVSFDFPFPSVQIRLCEAWDSLFSWTVRTYASGLMWSVCHTVIKTCQSAEPHRGFWHQLGKLESDPFPSAKGNTSFQRFLMLEPHCWGLLFSSVLDFGIHPRRWKTRRTLDAVFPGLVNLQERDLLVLH